MEDLGRLVARAEEAAVLLKARGETLAVAESSAGGLVSAALLAVPGASAYFVGGAVFIPACHAGWCSACPTRHGGVAPNSEAQALLLARAARTQLAPHGRWRKPERPARPATDGHPAGHAASPRRRQRGGADARDRVEDRMANMLAFAAAAIDLLARNCGGDPAYAPVIQLTGVR